MKKLSDNDTLTELDNISDSFCLAKWYNATVWLGSGMTTSCHHPPAHPIDVDALKDNPKLLHNTVQKKQDRSQMKKGERPSGCSYCWKIEDSGSRASDRLYKSKIYGTEAFKSAYNTPTSDDVDLRTLELAFDRTCNFACSYCSPIFSTTWVQDINKHGPYENLKGVDEHHYTHQHRAAQLYGINDSNPYTEAFFKWWESDLHSTLQELRITGGEPLMSPHFWRLLDWFKDNDSDIRLAINTNLGAKQELINKLILATHDIKNCHIYTSCEAVGDKAEYIRDGLNYEQWKKNLFSLLRYGKVQELHIMSTISVLALDGFTDFLTEINTMKQTCDRLHLSVNIVHSPSFHSVDILPLDVRQRYASEIYAYLKNDLCFNKSERDQIERLASYLSTAKTNEQIDDFITFYAQYDKRRQRSWRDTFPKLDVDIT